MTSSMNICLLVTLVSLVTTALCHECERPCVKGDTRTCMYEFHLQDYYTLGRACFDCPNTLSDCTRPDCIPADGTSKAILAVNKQLPGPAIQVCEGDQIIVDVYNGQLSDTDTIHWHGQHMRDHQYYDGVPFVTQCPIMGAFRYDFIAATPGTTWWHSHSGLHRAEGVFGALVVRKAIEVQADLYDADLFEHMLVLQDWVHQPSYVKYLGRHQYTNDDFADGILVNGKGRNTKAQADGVEAFKVAREVVTVTPGLSYRIRLVNAGSLNCPMIVSIDNHPLTVIASDGHDIIPVVVDSFVFYSGERFDIVIEANQEIGNYWIRFQGLIDCEPNECFQGAILRYESAPEEEPTAALSYSTEYPPGIVLNPLNAVGVEGQLTMTDITAFEPSLLEKTVDHKYYLGFDFNQINNTFMYDSLNYPYDGVAEEWQINTPQINDISFAFPSSPPLSQPDALQNTICKYGEETPCESDFCSCTYVIDVPLGDTVEFVIVDEGNIGDENHPYHLHGYSFNVVAMGKLGRNTSVADVVALDEAGGIVRKLENSVLKDSVTIPDGGYTIIRFTADNPGYWLMHCHLTFHSEIGMAALLKVGEPSDLPPVPEGFPTCGNFMPAAKTIKGSLQDTHSKRDQGAKVEKKGQ